MAQYSQQWWYPNGDPAAAVRATVFLEDNSTLASIFADVGMTVPLPNPTTTDGTGTLTFFVTDGTYWVYVGDDFTGYSELVTVSPFVTGAVLSVNGKTGIVVLDAQDVGAVGPTTFTAKGDLIVGAGPGAFVDLPVGSNGSVLTADSTRSSGLAWDVPPTAPVVSVNGKTGIVVLNNTDIGSQPISTITSKGDLYVGLGPSSVTRMGVGSDGQFLAASSASPSGLTWISPPASPVLSVNGQTGVVFLNAPDVGAFDITEIMAKGDLLIGTGASTVIRLPVGTNGDILVADSTQPEGMRWEVPPSAPVTSVNAMTGAVVLTAADVGAIGTTIVANKGDIIAATAFDNPINFPVGTDGTVLTSDSTQTAGLKWDVPIGTGNVVGPPSSTNTGIARYNGVTGKVIQDSTVTVSTLGTVNLTPQLGPYPTNPGDIFYDTNSQSLASSNDQIWSLVDRQTLMLVNNGTGSILSPGQPVYITGFINTYPYIPIVALAKADVDTTAHFVGICAHIIPVNGNGYVVSEGLLAGAPTSSFNVNDYLYVSPVAAGQLTNVRPSPPNLAVCVGVVMVTDNTHGALTVFRTEALVGQGDVDGPPASTDKGIARYSGTSGKIIQDSTIVVTDTGSMIFPGQGFPPAYADGEIYYDTNFHALVFTNDDSGIALKIGQQNYIRVHNNTGSVLSSGLAVYVTGSDGTYPYPPTVAPAAWTGEPQSHAIGITAEIISAGSYGYVLIDGLLYGVPTSSFNEGDYLYVGPGSGTLTNVKPSAPNFACVVGQVTVTDNVHGILSVFRTQAVLGLGSANQVRGVNAAGNAQENKTIQGTLNRVDVTNSVGAITIDVDNTLLGTLIPKSVITQKGDLIVGASSATPGTLNVGSDGDFLASDSTQTLGVAWKPITSSLVTSVNGHTGVVVLGSSDVGAQPIATITTKGDLYAGTGAGSTVRLGVGTDNFVLTADSTQTSGLSWKVIPSAPVSSVNGHTGVVVLTSADTGSQALSAVTTLGDLYVATASATTTRFPAGTNTQVIRANSATSTGLEYHTLVAADVGAVPTTRNVNTSSGLAGGGALSADLTLTPVYGTAANTITQGNDTRVVNAQQVTVLTSKADLYVATAASTVTREPVGSDGQVLTADSTQTTGIKWATPTAAPVTSVNGHVGVVVLTSADTGSQALSTVTTLGDLFVATGSATTTRLPAGTNTQVIRANSATSTGLEYHTLVASDVGAVSTATQVIAGTGLTGGGALTANVTLSASFGTAAGTITQGNDTRVVNAVQTSRNINTSTGLQGGGNLTADLTLSPVYGTTAGTVTQGNDSRITGSVQGPGSSTDTAIALFSGTTGKLIQNSNILVSSVGTVTLPAQTLASAGTNNQLVYTGEDLLLTYSDAAASVSSIGQQNVLKVHNSTGSTLASFNAVYITGNIVGSIGFIPTVALAQANALSTAKVAGITVKAIPNGSDGFITVDGNIALGNTSGTAVGDTLYLSAATPGAFTNVAPPGGDYVTKLGVVLNVSATIGAANIRIGSPSLGLNDGQIIIGKGSATGGLVASQAPSFGLFPGTTVGFFPAGGIGISRSSASATLNELFLIPFCLLDDHTLTNISFEVSAPVGGATMRVGLYSASSPTDPQPLGAPVADYGTIAAATVGLIQSSGHSTPLTAGVYYVALVGQTTAPTVRFSAGYSPYVATQAFVTGAAANGWSSGYSYAVAVSGALPTLTAGNITALATTPLCGFA